MKTYAQYKSNGKLWPAGHTVYGLCAAYNHATNPSLYLSETEHKRSFAYARAIKSRMSKLGFVRNQHFKETSNGSFWPIAC